MNNTPDILIQSLMEEACGLEESDRQADALERQLMANVMERFRDTLMKIARCQGGIPSAQAHEVLSAVGYCDHSRAIYKAPIKEFRSAAWVCPECGRIDGKQLEPYQ